ncbi:hypothetical protein B0H19DRAFT_1266376 [Mycena capillaripes]|nr:hypothetical protein B0H19DRAFT_1266376 [Mycena capillaripes]
MAAEVRTTLYMLRPVYNRLPAIGMHNTSPQPVPIASHIDSNTCDPSLRSGASIITS